ADPESVTRDLADYQALKEGERAGHVPSRKEEPGSVEQSRRKRQPSFNEQEALLREMTRRRRER
ncbi:MAG: TM2 domain-containing protein, partial [Thioalkalivibrio sp.]